MEDDEKLNTDIISEEQNKEADTDSDFEAARNARFNFGYTIQDDINGAVVQRTEERDGLKLTGEYSYSDGFFKRTVAYVADENGYRVTKMISEPIGNGPVTNTLGQATVQMLVSGVETNYAIQASPMLEETDPEVESTGPEFEETGPWYTGPAFEETGPEQDIVE